MNKIIDDIVDRLLSAKEAYYNSESSIMTDAEFDALEDQLREIDPDNSYFSKVGSDFVHGEKIKHVYPMLSMQKGKTIPDIAKWIEKLSVENTGFCIQPKIDGLSASIAYENGRIKYIATRGDGETGQIITHIEDYVSDIKKNISFSKDNIEVRGELYLPKNTSFDTGNRPLRNNCVGLINRKENISDLKYVRFVAYQIEGMKFDNENSKIDLLKKEGFNSVDYFIAMDISDIENMYQKYLDQLRSEWEFETDGLIITVNDSSLFDEIDSRWVIDHHHHYSIALKPPSESKETSLERIEWQVSRQGNVVPVAVFSPIIIGGAKIERASLANASTVRSMRLKKGSRLLVERANDVIPYVKENLSKNDDETDLIISECPSCSSKLTDSGVHIKCINQSCPEVNIQKILFWVKESSVENISEATIRKLFELGLVKSISDLYSLKAESLDIPGFAEKKTANFISEISKSRRMTASAFISKLGIPLVQAKTLAKLSIRSIDDFLSFNDETYVVGRNIIEWKNDSANMSYFNEILSAIEIVSIEEKETNGKICATGKGPLPRNELAKIITDAGYEFSDTVTKDLSVLLCDDVNSSSSKIAKAKKLGIKIMTYEDFLNA
ncbi:MAG: hypothetical protein KAZ87_04545 [Spirochaetes bacterium]|nr:hypothetical protein [Spirochaetota bacterium]